MWHCPSQVRAYYLSNKPVYFFSKIQPASGIPSPLRMIHILSAISYSENLWWGRSPKNESAKTLIGLMCGTEAKPSLDVRCYNGGDAAWWRCICCYDGCGWCRCAVLWWLMPLYMCYDGVWRCICCVSVASSLRRPRLSSVSCRLTSTISCCRAHTSSFSAYTVSTSVLHNTHTTAISQHTTTLNTRLSSHCFLSDVLFISMLHAAERTEWA